MHRRWPQTRGAWRGGGCSTGASAGSGTVGAAGGGVGVGWGGGRARRVHVLVCEGGGGRQGASRAVAWPPYLPTPPTHPPTYPHSHPSTHPPHAGTFADVIVIWARNSDTHQVNAFIVRKGNPGLRWVGVGGWAGEGRGPRSPPAPPLRLCGARVQHGHSPPRHPPPTPLRPPPSHTHPCPPPPHPMQGHQD